MENSAEKVLKTLRECGALLEGHFLLSSGCHSDRYVQCALLFQYPEVAELLLSERNTYTTGSVWSVKGATG